jgi:hypothetical protein
MLCSFSYSVCQPSCHGGETGQAREVEMNIRLLPPRRRADAVACVPTIESSLTPAGAAAIDRTRTPLDPSVCPSCRALAAISCGRRPFPVVSRAPSTVHSPACTSRTKVTILLPFRHRAHAGQGAALAHVPVSTRMSSTRKVKAFLLGFVPQRKLAHAPMLEDRRADDVLSHRCRMDLPGPTTSVGTRTDYSVGAWDYPTCAAWHLMA